MTGLPHHRKTEGEVEAEIEDRREREEVGRRHAAEQAKRRWERYREAKAAAEQSGDHDEE
jgi:hypothetical protein